MPISSISGSAKASYQHLKRPNHGGDDDNAPLHVDERPTPAIESERHIIALLASLITKLSPIELAFSALKGTHQNRAGLTSIRPHVTVGLRQLPVGSQVRYLTYLPYKTPT